MKYFTAPAVMVALALTATSAPSALAQSTEKLASKPDAIIYQAVPEYGGLEVAILRGHPNQEGPYTIRVKFPPGVRSKPHSHDQDRYITVISGTWHFGLGTSGGCEGTTPLPAGSFAKHPAGLVHYDGGCAEETLVQISGQGPVKTSPPPPAPAAPQNNAE